MQASSLRFRYYWVSYLLHVAYKALKEHLEKEFKERIFLINQ